MNKSATIFSNDNKFARMLEIELSSVGVEILHESKETSNYSDKELYYIIDFDSYELSDLSLKNNANIIIVFSKRNKKDLKNNLTNCSFFLKRPFLMSDFLHIFVNADNENIHKPKYQLAHKKHLFLDVDKKERIAIWGDMKIPLSENEYKLLSILCINRGELVERKKIEELFGISDGNMGDVYICHLRRKIDNKLGLKLIYTVRGKGYILKN